MPTLPTLLLADDSLTIQRVVALTFADQAVRVVVAKDGQDAINRMTSERPDLVLADTNMPCVDGYELARWVRQQPHLSAVPVLLLAGATNPVDQQRLHDSGANGVLEKPFEPSHVISRVKELLGLKPPPPAASEAVGPKKPGSGIFGAIATVAELPAPSRPVSPPQARATPATPADEVPLARGDARDSSAAHDSGPTSDARTSVAEELGVSGPRVHGPSDEKPSSTPPASPSNAADVFASLLAAEQGDPAATVSRSAAPELTPEMLDFLAARVVERLRPDVLRDELQRGLADGLRDAIAEIVRDSVATETRAAVAEAVQAVAPLVQQTVREIVGDAVRDAVAAAVPQAVLDAVRGDAGRQVNEIAHDTAERLVRDEIARIRERR